MEEEEREVKHNHFGWNFGLDLDSCVIDAKPEGHTIYDSRPEKILHMMQRIR